MQHKIFLNGKEQEAINCKIRQVASGATGVFTAAVPYKLSVTRGQTFRVDIEGNTLLVGLIKRIHRQRSRGIKTLTCYGYTHLLQNKYCVDEGFQLYENVDAGVIAKALIDHYFSGILTSTNINITTGVTINSLDCTDKTVYNMFKELAKRANCDFYVDTSLDTYFFVVGSVEAKRTIQPGDILDVDLVEDDLTKKDLIRVHGGGGRATSGTGDVEHLLVNTSILSIAEAQEVADALFGILGTGKVNVTVKVKGFYDVHSAEKILLNSPADDVINQYFIIQSMGWNLGLRNISSIIKLGAAGSLGSLTLKSSAGSYMRDDAIAEILTDTIIQNKDNASINTYQLFGHVVDVKRVATGFELIGLTFGRGNLFYLDYTLNIVYEINKETMALVNSFAGLGLNPAGLAYEDANSIWYGDRITHLIREVNPTTGVLVSSFNCGFDVSAIAYDTALGQLWIGCEDDGLIRLFTLAGALVRTISAIADVDALGLTYVDPYLYVLGVYIEGVLVEMETGVTPATPIRRYHAIKRGFWPYHGLAYDGEYLRVGSDSDGVTRSIISKVIKG